MEDADIFHSIMTVKEMIFCNYGLNEWQQDDVINNSGVLTGERPFVAQADGLGGLPRFHVPKF